MLLTKTLTAGLLAAVVTSPTPPDQASQTDRPGDSASQTAGPSAVQAYEVPDSVADALVFNPAVGITAAGPEPALELIRRPGCRLEGADLQPNLQVRLGAPVTIDDPLDDEHPYRQVVVEAGVYPGGQCDVVQNTAFIEHPDFGYVSNPGEAVTEWTDAQVADMIAAAGQEALITDDFAWENVTLRAQPAVASDPVAILVEGTRVEVGLPVMIPVGLTDVPLLQSHGTWQPARVDGKTGWLRSSQVSPFVLGGLASEPTLETEQVTVGDVAGAMEDPQGLAVYGLGRGVDLSDPYLTTRHVVGHLKPGDVVTASTAMWEASAPGLGWGRLVQESERLKEIPEEHEHLGSSGRLVELDDGVVGWAYAFLELDVADLTAGPTAVPTIAPPDQDEDEVTATAEPPVVDEPEVDPMSVPLATAVERRGSRVGVPSTFSILSQPSDDAPSLGVLEEGVVYRSSAEFTGEESLTHGDLWRAVELTGQDGTIRAFVHADDVIETSRAPGDGPAPTAGTGVIDSVLEKGEELTGAGVEKWNNRERGAWNPLKTITNTLAWVIAGPLTLLACGLLMLGGYRASVVAQGKQPRRGMTPVGQVAAIAPTGLGTVLAIAAAWFMPASRLGWAVAITQASVLVIVLMARFSSRRARRLTPDLAGVTWDQLVLPLVPGLLLGAAAWWLLGLQVAVVVLGAGLGAGLAFAGNPDLDGPEPETPAEPAKVEAGTDELDMTDDGPVTTEP